MLRFHPLSPQGNDVRPAAEPEKESAGTIIAALLVDEGALLVFGWRRDNVPSSATAILGQHGANASWSGASWTRKDDDTRHWFIGLLAFDNIASIAGGGIHLVPNGGGRAQSLPPVPRIGLSAANLLRALEEAEAPTAALLDFLRVARAALDPAGAPRWDAFLAEYLRTLSHQSGFIEIIGEPECGGILLQGWSFALAAGQRPMVVEGPGITIQDSVVATFARADLMDKASGVVAYLKDLPAGAVKDLCRIYFEAGGAIRHLDLVDAPIRLAPVDSVLHLRSQLAQLDADVPVLRAFKRVCRPRFEGVSNVDQITHPVRLAVDIVLDVPGEGVFVSGWLLDPRKLVRLVLLKSTTNFYCRIHDIWSRRPRPDVSEGFAQDPAFSDWMTPGADLHGFVAFAPRKYPIGAGEQLYFEVVLEDESCIFLPVDSDARPVERVVRDVLSAVRLDDPTLETLVSRHIGPAVSGALAIRPSPRSAAAVTPFGVAGASPRVSVVMSIEGDGSDLDIHLAGWSTDPDFKGAEIIVVAPRAVGERIATPLKRQAEFYGLAGRLVLTHDVLDVCDATEVGVAHASADRLLLLSESVFPQAPGWLARLESHLLRHPGAGAISPTLLYEDFSIHFAGLSQVEEPGASVDRLRRYTGYPRHWLTEVEVTPVHAVATECCLVARESFMAIGGFSREFTDPDYKALDFSRRLCEAGRPCLWSPSVNLFALDPDHEVTEAEYWMKPAREVDAWRFAEKWSPKSVVSGPDGVVS